MPGGKNHIYCARCGKKLGHRVARQSYMTAPFMPLPRFVAIAYGRRIEYTLRMPRNPVCERCPTDIETNEGEK